jgi:Response regulators consisting of a CheY-like receiver domain and a winged-helix DNA-binding domain
MNEIYIVDDEADIREILEFNLQANGYSTASFSTAETAEEAIAAGGLPSLILLDVMLPGMSGFKLADKLRKEHDLTTPIIFLTARNSENDLLTGFSAGGDDYISKPFSINEVVARVKAVLKRTTTPAESDTISCGCITINKKDKTVCVNSTFVEFSKKEFEILELLVSNPGKVFSRSDFITILWKDYPYVIDRTIDVHIARIRTKLGTARDMIQNKVGFGYSISAT